MSLEQRGEFGNGEKDFEVLSRYSHEIGYDTKRELRRRPRLSPVESALFVDGQRRGKQSRQLKKGSMRA